jgi:hypothetical protein
MFYSRALTIVFHQLVFIVNNLGIFLLITVSISKIFSHRNYPLLMYFQDYLCTWDYLILLKTCAWWALFNILYHYLPTDSHSFPFLDCRLKLIRFCHSISWFLFSFSNVGVGSCLFFIFLNVFKKVIFFTSN